MLFIEVLETGDTAATGHSLGPQKSFPNTPTRCSLDRGPTPGGATLQQQQQPQQQTPGIPPPSLGDALKDSARSLLGGHSTPPPQPPPRQDAPAPQAAAAVEGRGALRVGEGDSQVQPPPPPLPSSATASRPNSLVIPQRRWPTSRVGEDGAAQQQQQQRPQQQLLLPDGSGGLSGSQSHLTGCGITSAAAVAASGLLSPPHPQQPQHQHQHQQRETTSTLSSVVRVCVCVPGDHSVSQFRGRGLGATAGGTLVCGSQFRDHVIWRAHARPTHTHARTKRMHTHAGKICVRAQLRKRSWLLLCSCKALTMAHHHAAAPEHHHAIRLCMCMVGLRVPRRCGRCASRSPPPTYPAQAS